MWSPFTQSFNTFPQTVGFNNTQSHDSEKIELPGGGFIEKPGSEPQSRGMCIQNDNIPINVQPDKFETPEERLSLMNKLDMLLEERAARERTLQDLFAQGQALEQTLYQVNAALDFHSNELAQLTDILRTKKEQMVLTIQNKRSAVASLKETLQQLQREETRNSSYRIVAAESRVLKEQISKANEEKKVLQQKIDELDHTADTMELRSKIIEQEEKTLEKNLLAFVQKLAENGDLKYRYHSARYEFDEEPDTNTITVQVQTHHQAKQTRPSLQPTPHKMIPQISNKELAKELAEQLAITKAEEQIVEETEVVEDNGAPKRKVKKGGLFSSLKKLFGRKPKRRSGSTKSKNELNMNVLNDPKPSEMMDMVTVTKANLHVAAELCRETSAQESTQFYAQVTLV